MPKQEHTYKATIQWTGNRGQGTIDYKSYDRDHSIIIKNKATILGSSDSAFRGNKARHNPEDLLVSSVSACHMLWYLHLCAVNKIIVTDYIDEATGTMQVTEDGSGYFTQITLQPTVIITNATMTEKAWELHHEANKKCFISNSVNFPILHNPIIKVAE